MDSLINYGSDSDDDDEQQTLSSVSTATANIAAPQTATTTTTLPALGQLLHTLPAPTKRSLPSVLKAAHRSADDSEDVAKHPDDAEARQDNSRPAAAAAIAHTAQVAVQPPAPAAGNKPTAQLKSLFELLPPAQNTHHSSATSSRHHHQSLLPTSKKRKRKAKRSDDDSLSVSSPELDPLQTLDDDVQAEADDDDNIAIDPQLLKSLQEQAALQFDDELPAEQPTNGNDAQQIDQHQPVNVEYGAHHHIDPSRSHLFASPPQQQPPPPPHNHAADKMWRQFADATSDAVEINANDLTRRSAADAALLTLEREKAAAAEKDKAFSAKLYNARAGEDVSTGKVSSTQRRTHHINQVAAQSAQLELEMQRRKAMGQQQKQRAKSKYGW